MPTFSIVIPLYNKEKYVQRAIQSVLHQSFQDFEIIVVNDGSTDNSVKQVEQSPDPRIKIIHQNNAGVSAARNKGIEIAKSELIAFLDADDEWKPEFLASILILRHKFPQAGAYATSYEEILPNGIVKNHIGLPEKDKLVNNSTYFYVESRGRNLTWSSAICIPKFIFMSIGLFQVGEKFGEDLDMWCRIAIQHPIAWTSYIGATYWRDDAKSACNANAPDRRFPFVVTAKKYIESGKIPCHLIRDIRYYVISMQISVAMMNIMVGKSNISRRILFETIQDGFWHYKIIAIYIVSFFPIRVVTLIKRIKQLFTIYFSNVKSDRINFKGMII